MLSKQTKTVAFPEPDKVSKILPEVKESRQALIEAVTKTEAYRSRKLLSATKNPLSEQLHTLVSVAKDRSQLYGKDVDTTANNLIKHMALLESIGNTLNPTSGLYTARGEQSLNTSSKSAPPSFSPEDRTVLVKFLTSEAKLCAQEIDKVGQAIDASEKYYANFALHKSGMAGIRTKTLTFNGEKPEVYLKMEYHKVQEQAYARAADDYHQAARLFSEAQLYDSAIQGQQDPQGFQEQLQTRIDYVTTHEMNSTISTLTDSNTTNMRRDVKAEIDIMVENQITEEERTDVKKGGGLLSGRAYRSTNPSIEIAQSKATVRESDIRITDFKKVQADSRKHTAENLDEIETLRTKILEVGTKFVGEKDNASKKYQSLMTQSKYYEDAADKTTARAAKEIENDYKDDKGYNLNSNKDLMKSEDINLRTKLTKFKELKATVAEFQDNLSAFVSSVAPMKTTRERSASVSISKKPPAEAEAQSPAVTKITRERSSSVSKTPSSTAAAQNPAIAGLLRSREANQTNADPKKEKEQEQEQTPVEPRHTSPKGP